jgi:hypothetical protein
MKLINITVTSSNDPRTLKYKVELQNNSGTWTQIHYGKFFVPANTTTVTLDLDDLLINYRFRGKQSIEPILSVANSQYEMPVSAAAYVTDNYYNQIRIVSLDTPSGFTTVSKYFYFFPTQVFGYDFSMPTNSLFIPSVAEGLIPRIPGNPPAGFNFSVIVFNTYTTSIHTVVKKDNTNITTVAVSSGKAYYFPLSGATNAYYVNNKKVAQIDECNKPYYLLWLNNAGGLQCQGFLATSEFGRKYDNKTRVDNKNVEWRVSSTATGNWKLKSSNLTDDEYKIYGELFNSPYLVLIDMKNNRIHYVNISKSDYQEKMRTRTSKKPIYFELELNSAEHLRI